MWRRRYAVQQDGLNGEFIWGALRKTGGRVEVQRTPCSNCGNALYEVRASYLPSICSQDGRRGASPSGPYACKKLTRGQWNGVRGPDLSAMQPLDMRHPGPQIAYTQGGPYSRVELPLWNCGKHSQTQGLVVARHDDGTVSAYHGACRARTSTSWEARSV